MKLSAAKDTHGQRKNDSDMTYNGKRNSADIHWQRRFDIA